ncbi:MAG: Bug family tripartite tricarboxylate transporter substrate binding protein [Burkholderiales bacterium]
MNSGLMFSAGLLFTVLAVAPVSGQSYPAKPIRMVIPQPPGGGTDLMGRLLGTKLATFIGQPVVIDYRAGAAGAIGNRNVMQSAPDGYSILFGVGSDMVLAKLLSKDAPVDPLNDLTPIIAAVAPISCIAVSISAPVTNMAELITYAKANPGKLTFGSPGTLSAPHIYGEKLRSLGVDMLHVPFKGQGPSMAALLGGQIDVALSNMATVIANARGGKIKIVAISQTKRQETYPDVPAVVEFLPGGDQPQGWYGVFGPLNLPRPIVNRINEDMHKVLADKETKAKIDEANFVTVGGSADQFVQQVQNLQEVYSRTIRAAGIKGE